MSVDFLSTRETTSIETRRCANLVLAIIVQAIRDAAEKPTKDELQLRKNNSLARSAVEFLFKSGSNFEAYAVLIGLNAQSIREALLSDVALGSSTEKLFSEQMRRVIKMRQRWQFPAVLEDSQAERFAA
jgi:hypothetical protein